MKMPENKAGGFSLSPSGTHLAICVKLVDLGTQTSEYKGEKKRNRKIMIGWELPYELIGDKPLLHYQRYTLSSNEKSTLRKHLEAWRNKPFNDKDFGSSGFELKKLLGAPCSLIIAHTEREGRTYANTAGIGPIPKGTKMPPSVNPPVYFSLEEFDRGQFEALPEGFQKIIMASPEYAQVSAGVSIGAAVSTNEPDEDEEIPF
jgi:hypothetical protein